MTLVEFVPPTPHPLWKLCPQMGITDVIVKVNPELTGLSDPWRYETLAEIVGRLKEAGLNVVGLEGDPFDMTSIKEYGAGDDNSRVERVDRAENCCREEVLAHYRELLESMARMGIKLLCYNFMFVNGKSMGRRTKNQKSELDRYRLRWNDVVYESGEIKVVAYDASGRAVEEKTVRTAGSFDRLVVEPEPAGRPDRDAAYPYPRLRYFHVKAVDAKGTLCPDCDLPVSVRVSGGKFRGICNGDATSLEVFSKPRMRLFHGELVVTVECEAGGTEDALHVLVDVER